MINTAEYVRVAKQQGIVEACLNALRGGESLESVESRVRDAFRMFLPIEATTSDIKEITTQIMRVVKDRRSEAA